MPLSFVSKHNSTQNYHYQKKGKKRGRKVSMLNSVLLLDPDDGKLALFLNGSGTKFYYAPFANPLQPIPFTLLLLSPRANPAQGRL